MVNTRHNSVRLVAPANAPIEETTVRVAVEAEVKEEIAGE